jgi:hypothetical protein
MTAAGRLLSGTAERCSRLLAHAARASAASNSAHGHKTVGGEKKACARKTKPPTPNQWQKNPSVDSSAPKKGFQSVIRL